MRGLEQEPPERPNFLLVVLLFGATIIVVFFVAYFVLEWSGIVPAPHNKHPTSQLVLPSPTRSIEA